MEQVPVHFVRYEDLLTKPEETLEGLFCYVLNRKSIDGLNIQKRIRAAVAMGHQATRAYEQKIDFEQSSGQIEEKTFIFNRNIHFFTDEQQQFISETLQEHMEIFGYCSQYKPGEQEIYETSEEWLTEQQTKFNFAKYKEVDED